MIRFWSEKLIDALATILAVSFIVYVAIELNADEVAVKVLGQFSTPEQRHLWLLENGYDQPFLKRYLQWLWQFTTGDWGTSLHYKERVATLLADRLRATGVLAFATLIFMVPIALILGIVAGMEAGSKWDRSISLFAILTTSIPEFASAVFLSGIFVYWLGWLPGASTMIGGFSVREIVLPVSVLVLYSAGYLTRITRASMADVMNAPYIRTALMKGASKYRIVFHHALRNAMIAPVTVIMLQVPWLLSGVIVVEAFFAYKGFGTLLYDASLQSDIFLIEACAMVSVVVVLATQLSSDIIYSILNPRLTPSYREGKPR